MSIGIRSRDANRLHIGVRHVRCPRLSLGFPSRRSIGSSRAATMGSKSMLAGICKHEAS